MRSLPVHARGSSKALLIAMALTGVLVTTACVGGSGQSGAEDIDGGDALRIALPPTVAPANLDPARGASTGPDLFFDLAYEPLIHIEQDGSFAPALAEEWGYEEGSNNQVFWLKLRGDAKFSDGTPVNAAAVKAWLEYYMGAGGGFAMAFGPDVTVEATGDYEVKIRMTSPNPDMEWLLAQTNGSGFVASTAALDGEALTKGTYGAGQYVYDATRSVPGDNYVLVPNKYYYDQSKIQWDEVTIKVVGTPSSLAQGLASGQFDVGVGTIGTIGNAESAGLEIVRGQLSWDGGTFLNRAGKDNPYSDPRVRQAVNLAVDRKRLVEGLIEGEGTSTSSWMALDGVDKDSMQRYSYDPEKAKELLAEAGYADGVTLRLLGPAGTLTSGTPTDSLVQAMAQQMEAAGIKLEPTLVSGAQFTTELASGKYDLFMASFGMNSYSTYYPIFVSEAAYLNQGKVRDETIEALTKDYLSAKDPDAVSVQVTKYVTDQSFHLPLLIPTSVMFHTDDIENVVFPTGKDTLGQAIYPDPTEWK